MYHWTCSSPGRNESSAARQMEIELDGNDFQREKWPNTCDLEISYLLAYLHLLASYQWDQ